jgi:hypothetical protein
MLEFIPERIDNVVFLNVMQQSSPSIPPLSQTQTLLLDSFVGADYVVGVHNWLIGTELRYLLFDLQDEKDVPQDFLEELMQLMRRLRIPFLFAGVMDKPKAVLKSYAYLTKFPIFKDVEEARSWIIEKYPQLVRVNIDSIQYGAPIEMVRSRLNGKPGEEADELTSDADE